MTVLVICYPCRRAEHADCISGPGWIHGAARCGCVDHWHEMAALSDEWHDDAAQAERS